VHFDITLGGLVHAGYEHCKARLDFELAFVEGRFEEQSCALPASSPAVKPLHRIVSL